MNNKKIISYSKLILVMIIWASVYHVAKYLIGFTDIFTLGFLRFFIATIVLLTIYFTKNGVKGSFTRPDIHWILLLLLGLIGVFGYNIFFLGAESLILANDVAIFYSFTPCITIILGRFILKQKISPLAYLGIIIALFGTVGIIILTRKNSAYACTTSCASLHLGQTLAILSAFAMAIYNVLNKKASYLGLDALTITTFSSLIGTIFLFITALLFGSSFATILHKPLMFWLIMAYLAIIATVIAYKWYSDAMSELGVSQVAVFQNSIPLCAVLIGVIILGHHISIEVILSGLIIIIGVVMTNLSMSKNQN